MILLATLTVLLSRAADLILATDQHRGLRMASKAERDLLSGRWS
jgi:hypothetical protein